jgi:glycosyl transferase family 87
VITLIALTAIAWATAGLRVLLRHEPHPLKSIIESLTVPVHPFTDFTGPGERVSHFGEPHLLTRTDLHDPDPYPYPVPSIFAYLFFLRLFPNPLAAYLTFAVLSFLVATVGLSLLVFRTTSKMLPQVAIWSTLVLGFPLLILCERANIEAVIWVFVLLGLVAFARSQFLISAISWAIAASMKITPGVLCLLFIAKRKYWMLALAVAATAAFSVLSFAAVGPTTRQAASDSSKSASFLRNEFILVREGGQFDESLFGATKQLVSLYDYARRKNDRPFPKILPGTETGLRIYNILIPIGAVLLYWFRLRHLPLLNQFMAYVILGTLLPQVSYEYKLVHMYLVWGAFLLFLLTDVVSEHVTIPAKAIHAILLSCAVMFIPLTYFEIEINGQIKMSFLVLILWTVLKVPMPSSLFGDLQPPSIVKPPPRGARFAKGSSFLPQ